jgi:hypothetical protein
MSYLVYFCFLRMVLYNTYCAVFFCFDFFRSVASFSGSSLFKLPLRYSITFIYITYLTKEQLYRTSVRISFALD